MNKRASKKALKLKIKKEVTKMEMFQYVGKIKILKRLNNILLVKLLDADNYIELQTKSGYKYNYNLENLDRNQCSYIVEYYYNESGSGKIESIKEVK